MGSWMLCRGGVHGRTGTPKEGQQQDADDTRPVRSTGAMYLGSSSLFVGVLERGSMAENGLPD